MENKLFLTYNLLGQAKSIVIKEESKIFMEIKETDYTPIHTFELKIIEDELVLLDDSNIIYLHLNDNLYYELLNNELLDEYTSPLDYLQEVLAQGLEENYSL